MWKTKHNKWKKLDNAGKIFPAIADRADAEVFRVSCQLKEPVQPDLLQLAVDSAVNDYPLFTETIRRGIFWYYMEDTGLHPIVHEENKSPLQPLYVEGNKLLIDISYYGSRINFEIFHAIADGTGAFIFFKAIVATYLLMAHPEELHGVDLETLDSTQREQLADSFTQHFSPDKGSSVNFEFLGNKGKKNKVYRFSEAKTPDYRQLVTEGCMSTRRVLDASHEAGGTVTEFICAQLILAIHDTMEPRDRNKTVAVAIPVNLRNYFDSNTIRNFFGIIQVDYDFSEEGEHTLTDVIQSVKQSFARELTYENMQQKIASQVKMERHPIVRVCPLILKDLIMNILQRVSMKRRTITLSNVGKVKMQPELAKFIEMFDVFNSSSTRQVCMCTFGDNMVISFSGLMAEHSVERAFFRRMAQVDDGIVVSASYDFRDFARE